MADQFLACDWTAPRVAMMLNVFRIVTPDLWALDKCGLMYGQNTKLQQIDSQKPEPPTSILTMISQETAYLYSYIQVQLSTYTKIVANILQRT